MRFNKMQRLMLEEMLGMTNTIRLLDDHLEIGIGSDVGPELTPAQNQAIANFFDSLPKSPEHPDRVKLGGNWIDKTQNGFIGSIRRILCDPDSFK